MRLDFFHTHIFNYLFRLGWVFVAGRLSLVSESGCGGFSCRTRAVGAQASVAAAPAPGCAGPRVRRPQGAQASVVEARRLSSGDLRALERSGSGGCAMQVQEGWPAWSQWLWRTFNCSAARRIFPGRGSEPCPPNRQSDSGPRCYGGCFLDCLSILLFEARLNC